MYNHRRIKHPLRIGEGKKKKKKLYLEESAPTDTPILLHSGGVHQHHHLGTT